MKLIKTTQKSLKFLIPMCPDKKILSIYLSYITPFYITWVHSYNILNKINSIQKPKDPKKHPNIFCMSFVYLFCMSIKQLTMALK